LQKDRRKFRDVRLDFFRGLALAAIAVNHTVPPAAIYENYGHYRFGQWFAFNFADVFVLISGIACGIAYLRPVREGFGVAFRKAIGRCGGIYLGAMAALAVVLAMVFLIRSIAGDYAVHPFGQADPTKLAEPWAWLRVMLVMPPFSQFGILQFYVLMLLATPLVIAGIRWNKTITLLLSGGLWVCVTVADRRGWPVAEWTTTDFCNVLAWQFLFCIGLFLGVRRRRKGPGLLLPVWSRLPVAVGAVGMLLLGDYLRQSAWIAHQVSEKHFLGPLRLAELLAVMVLVGRLIPPQAALMSVPPLSLLTRLGRHSLPVFCVTIVASYAGTHLAAAADVGRAGYLVVLSSVLGGTIAIGWWISRRSERNTMATSPGAAAEGSKQAIDPPPVPV
jgi:hypothetical protein